MDFPEPLYGMEPALPFSLEAGNGIPSGFAGSCKYKMGFDLRD
jgi:hypothetical protein